MNRDELWRLKEANPEYTRTLEPLLEKLFSPDEAQEWLFLLLSTDPDDCRPVLLRLFHEGYSALVEKLFLLQDELTEALRNQSCGEQDTEVLEGVLRFSNRFLFFMEMTRESFLLKA